MKKIKAWALVWKDDNRLGMDAHGRKDWDTCYDIFTQKKYALAEKRGKTKELNRDLKAVPCTITY